jgi:hypothetical protein
MPILFVEATLAGAPEHIFDIVTTARYWLQWHPATIGVAGVIDRPYRQGDTITERAQIGAHIFEGTWQVVDHQRPLRATLSGAGGRVQIRYAFRAEGSSTIFRRELEYAPEVFAASGLDYDKLAALMERQSEESLRRLLALVEQLLT